MEKRRYCFLGAISPLFHNIFNISLTSEVKLYIHLVNVVVRFIISSILQIYYVEIRISRSILESLGLRDNTIRLYLVQIVNTNAHITKTSLYNFDPLKPHFYIVKLGFIGVYFISLISVQKHRLWVLVRKPRRGGSNEYPQSMF